MVIDVELLKRVPYFADLNPLDMEQVAKALGELRFVRGEVVFLEGDPCAGVYLVASGRVRIYKISPEGREQVLLIAGIGETFNEVPVFDDGPNPATVEALEPTVLYFLPKEEFLDLAARYPAMGQGVMRVFASRLRHLTGIVEDLSFRHVRSRVAKALLQWQEQAQGAGTSRLTQRQIAAMAGTAREVAARALKALEREGAVRIERGRIVLADRQKLLDLI